MAVALVLALTTTACLGSGEDSTIGDCNIRHGADCPGNYMGARSSRVPTCGVRT